MLNRRDLIKQSAAIAAVASPLAAAAAGAVPSLQTGEPTIRRSTLAIDLWWGHAAHVHEIAGPRHTVFMPKLVRELGWCSLDWRHADGDPIRAQRKTPEDLVPRVVAYLAQQPTVDTFAVCSCNPVSEELLQQLLWEVSQRYPKLQRVRGVNLSQKSLFFVENGGSKEHRRAAHTVTAMGFDHDCLRQFFKYGFMVPDSHGICHAQTIQLALIGNGDRLNRSIDGSCGFIFDTPPGHPLGSPRCCIKLNLSDP